MKRALLIGLAACGLIYGELPIIVDYLEAGRMGQVDVRHGEQTAFTKACLNALTEHMGRPSSFRPLFVMQDPPTPYDSEFHATEVRYYLGTGFTEYAECDGTKDEFTRITVGNKEFSSAELAQANLDLKRTD